MSNSQSQVREAAAREWRSNPSLHDEFSSEGAFVAFRAAKARGAARIFAPSAPVRTFNNSGSSGNHAQAARDVRSDAAGGASPAGMNIVIGRAVARDDREAIKSIVREYQQAHRPGSYRMDEISGFVAARAGLSEAQARYALEQSCSWTQQVD